ncbi:MULTISPECIES: hypothetical protein [Staphylococcus]|nr:MULTISPECIES: hypothetical protein [Staphylococcus]KGF26751.1 hypothetical protein HMPREF2135_07330 [Staphylococcus haemolyticus DNF00585]MCH4389636.1 hypothetical protein [Staphylococcus haemolyticus]MCH4403923.1 hypothetical protein [Staphylococcus haemolyticus]MCH4443280.1 hypothetical protein [Staphylococcus haemolyticus]MCI2945574.1 hypothetical protein [Staphylococcus haemolyticus]
MAMTKDYFIAVLHNHNGLIELRRRLTEPFSVLVILMKSGFGIIKRIYLEFLPIDPSSGQKNHATLFQN